MIGKPKWETIRELRDRGVSVSAISRMLDLDRKTVRRALRQAQWTGYERAATGSAVLGEHMQWLSQRAPEVRFSARVLYQELRASRDYQGSYETVKLAVRPLRAESAAEALTQRRYETEPGHQAQVDWGQVRVMLGEVPSTVHVFVMTLGYSRRAWAEGYANERMEALLSAHEHAFEHFGGVTAEILYDRMRTVFQGVQDGKPRWNARFEAFAAHWGFQPRLCRAYRAQTKGKVESGVKYVKINFVPGRAFRDLEDFNDQLRGWLSEISDVRIHGTTHERPIERFAREASLLMRRPGHTSFVQAQPRDRVVASDWLVSIEANRYSVPWQLIGKTVQVVRTGAQWQICHRGRVVAVHEVLAGRHQLRVAPEHGPGAAVRNARTRFTQPAASGKRPDPEGFEAVQVRDLALYDQLAEVAA